MWIDPPHRFAGGGREQAAALHSKEMRNVLRGEVKSARNDEETHPPPPPRHCAGRKRPPFRAAPSPRYRWIVGDVRPFERAALRDVALELDVVREAERQQFVLAATPRPASACPRRRSRPRRRASRRLSAPSWRSPPRRSGSRWARRSARCASARWRPKCRARARSCGSAGRARRICRFCPAAWNIP